MEGSYPGTFEEIVLLAVCGLGDDTCGHALREARALRNSFWRRIPAAGWEGGVG